MVGVDAGNAVTPSTGPPTSDGVLYILHMCDGTIPTVRKNKFTENRQSVNETLIFRRQRFGLNILTVGFDGNICVEVCGFFWLIARLAFFSRFF